MDNVSPVLSSSSEPVNRYGEFGGVATSNEPGSVSLPVTMVKNEIERFRVGRSEYSVSSLSIGPSTSHKVDAVPSGHVSHYGEFGGVATPNDPRPVGTPIDSIVVTNQTEHFKTTRSESSLSSSSRSSFVVFDPFAGPSASHLSHNASVTAVTATELNNIINPLVDRITSLEQVIGRLTALLSNPVNTNYAASLELASPALIYAKAFESNYNAADTDVSSLSLTELKAVARRVLCLKNPDFSSIVGPCIPESMFMPYQFKPPPSGWHLESDDDLVLRLGDSLTHPMSPTETLDHYLKRVSRRMYPDQSPPVELFYSYYHVTTTTAGCEYIPIPIHLRFVRLKSFPIPRGWKLSQDHMFIVPTVAEMTRQRFDPEILWTPNLDYSVVNN